MSMTDYQQFLKSKRPESSLHGFEPVWLPDFLFDFQKVLVEWAVRKGRAALFEDCGLGKTPQQLVWAENVVRKTNGRVLILTPLAVGPQTVREGVKFGIEVKQSRDGSIPARITVTNYERLHHFDPAEFTGVVADESSILKNFDGKTRKSVTDFLGKVPYRLLCTATPAPNDFMELGTSSEALGVVGRNQMLGMFFTNDDDTTQKWRLKGHAKKPFWRWMATWARAVRKPSDLGFKDGKFRLPPLKLEHFRVPSVIQPGRLFTRPARTIAEQRAERKATLRSRCEKVAEVVPAGRSAVVWCHLNAEGDLLEKLIQGAVQVAGSEPDRAKEVKLESFASGELRVLVTKPRIAGFGLNWQHCRDVCYFPSWSHEQYYQAIRRCWRFGQDGEVACRMVYSGAESLVVSGMLRKERQSIELYDSIIRHMGESVRRAEDLNGEVQKVRVPGWLR